ncbi:complement receptor type 2-like isoform X2 [Dysidea avara]|uniref:complement receptor type 2-like isoform X2 n=1 Tax=Dysidea avara TaxID=196820 RepID=UPI0033266BA4
MPLSHSNYCVIFVLIGLSANLEYSEAAEETYTQSPWYITLYISCPISGNIKTCGGSLISQEWILTTASCVSCDSGDTNRMIVVDVGSVNEKSWSFDTIGMGRYIVDKVVIHNKFKKSRNNIALVHLQYAVLHNPKHTLLQVNRCYQVNDVGKRSSVELMLQNTSNTGQIENNLAGKMKMIRQSKCADLSISCLKSEVSTAAASSDFCATFVHNINLTCHYSEGMPLGMKNGNHWMVVGFVIDKPEDCSACPTLFTRVCNYYEWIENIMLATDVPQDLTCSGLVTPKDGHLLGVSHNTTATVGTVAQFVCPVGTILKGNSVIMCQNDGRWSGPAPECHPLDTCPRLTNPSSGRIVYQTRPSYVGNEAIYQCSTLNESVEVFRNCLVDGVWESLPVECNIDSPPNNVKAEVLSPQSIKVSWQPILSTEVAGYTVSYTSVVRYARGDNVTVSGATTSHILIQTLEENTHYDITVKSVTDNSISDASDVISVLTWTDVPAAAPRNVEVQSLFPASVIVSWKSPPGRHHNGLLTGYIIHYFKDESDETETFANTTTHIISGLISATNYTIQVAAVNSNGTGPFSVPTVAQSGKGKVCQDIPVLLNGNITYTGYDVGDMAQYTCEFGYAVHGPMNRDCLRSGAWSGKNTSCERLCPQLSSPLNGNVTFKSTKYLSRARYSCQDGYRLVGVQTIRCKRGGQWNNDPPKCEAITGCGNPAFPINGFVNFTTTTTNSIAVYYCKEKYTLIGSDTARCLPDRKWSGIVPWCRLLCPAIGDEPNRIKRRYDQNIGGITEFACTGSYVLRGVRIITCGSDGRWSNKEPICYKRCTNAIPIQNGLVVQSGVELDDTANYTCNRRYKMAPNSVSSIVCMQNGRWSHQPPRCDIITCPSLTSPSNGYIDSTNFTAFSKIKYSCYAGYKLIGKTSTSCQVDSTWTNSPPQCKRLCPALEKPLNGSVTYMDLFEGNEATFTCNLGYSMLGPAVTRCLSSGVWDSSPPTCYKPCVDPPLIANGQVIISGRTPSSNATYSCNDHFKLVGNAVLSCQTNSQWSGRAPKCKLIRCPRSTPLLNGDVVVLDRKVGSTVNYSCHSEYILFGPSTRNCSVLGTWTGNAPVCLRNCDIPPPSTDNGSVTVLVYNNSLVANYSCDSNYVMEGDKYLTCKNNGSWSGIIPKCFIQCPRITALHNGSVTVSDRKVGDTVTYSCHGGYLLFGPAVRYCSKYGNWTENTPTCIRDCGLPPAIKSGTVVVKLTTQSQVADYSCDNGFTIDRNESLVCDSNRKWVGTIPICKDLSLLQCSSPSAVPNGVVSVYTLPSDVKWEIELETV